MTARESSKGTAQHISDSITGSHPITKWETVIGHFLLLQLSYNALCHNKYIALYCMNIINILYPI